MPEEMRPSPWIARFAGLISPGGPVLDVACGGGRHARLFRARGHPVTVVDRDLSRVADLQDVEKIAADLEDGSPWPLPGRVFAGVATTNYLHRPILPLIVAALAPGGVLLYETFALGQERFGRPKNPEFLLRPGELLAACAGLTVVAYEHGLDPGPTARQRICAVRGPALLSLDGGSALSSAREEST